MQLLTSKLITDKNFPPSTVREGLFLLSLSDLGLSSSRYINCAEIFDVMRNMGLTPGTMSELQHYAATWDGKTQVIALGTLWKAGFGDNYAGCLCLSPDGPELTLRDVDFGWTQDDHFLVARSNV